MEFTFLRPWAPQLLSLLRIFAAASFLTHGLMKYFSWPGPFPGQLTAPFYIAGVLEIVGGILLLIGLFSRPVAFILAAQMAVAFFVYHFSRNFFPVLNGGEAAMLFCFIFLYITAAGPGPWSVDAATRRE
ncbi:MULTISPECIES: DoxX family protein [unclassified Beijerinckia]|uniref:DoxX family protein n=1 Tax=unclassified Beijerinckia TaxID=2638183 RepID=UPI00089A6A59|nr:MULTISPECIES: DoxX family protein [unclassified Beijerinckia]MDH7795429.1 putative oxidoreductase [Beijerinckia sp. GAS462]SEC01191.1 putative oxidoreductase [Beijerinckia sp. 28-YEA-48]